MIKPRETMSDSHDEAPRSGENAVPPPPPEPQSPLWLPALGVLLFVAAGVFWAMHSSNSAKPDSAAAATKTAGSAHASASAAPH